MNALHGGESALMSLEKLSLLLGYSSSDRTSDRIPSSWTWCSSTSAVRNLITSNGRFGCIVLCLHIFANYFAIPDLDEYRDLDQNQNSDSREEGKYPRKGHTLINQAFAVCVRKVLDVYNAALNTLSASVSLRRMSKKNDGGCLTRVSHSEITLLEVYLHTRGITTQMEALGNICNVNHLAVGFPVSSLDKANSELRMSYRVEQHKGDVLCFSILTDTRQEIFLVIHLTTLAIYCQAQDKSFCIYFAAICSITTIPSILVQVEDMSDLESVHMLYLTESLHICFLSNETQSTAKIIQKILQCSMDYRSCLTGRIWEGRSFDEKSSNRFS
ncbi:uncharacterized protein [Primulina eburnea]|uniref:uncharacterized protein n=1 Tax=Primulina eburnea TaxID=1245227 RepID=UPI003C6BEABF